MKIIRGDKHINMPGPDQMIVDGDRLQAVSSRDQLEAFILMLEKQEHLTTQGDLIPLREYMTLETLEHDAETYENRGVGMKAERLYGSRETLNSRYYKLYGEKDFSGRIDADRNKLKKLYITVTVIFAAAAVISIIGYFTGSSGVHLDRRGNITSVDRPAADSGRIYIDADVTAVRGRHKAEKKERLKIVPEGVEGESAGGAGDILSSETAEEKLQRQISSEVRAVNSGTEGSAILLPSELEDGTKLYWKERKENDLPYLLLAFFMRISGKDSRNSGRTKFIS